MNKNEIIWETDKEPATLENIKNYEKLLSITFPESYKKIALKYHGGIPNRYLYDTKEEKEKMFGNLLSFDNDPYDDLLKNYKSVKNRLKEEIVPFAIDPFGNYICFDYSNKEKMPSVVLWDHETAHKSIEEAIKEISKSFEDFIDSLYEIE